MKERNASVELLRCLFMFMVVLWHARFYGVFPNDELSPMTKLLFGPLIAWHVDGFVSISGYFGIKFSWSKFFKLYGLTIYAKLLSVIFFYMILPFTYGSVNSCMGEVGWFVGTYCMLMFLAPFLNAAIDALYKQSRVVLLSAWGLFAIAITLDWAPFIHEIALVHPNGGGGYSILTMIFVYLSARMARRIDLHVGNKCYLLVVGAFLTMSLMCVFIAVMLRKFGGGNDNYNSYNAPHVWGMAIFTLVWFADHINISRPLGRAALFLAPSMFSVYLLHDTTCFGHALYMLPQQWLSVHSGMTPGVIIFCSAVVAFSVSVALDMIRRGVITLIRRVYRAHIPDKS